LQKLQNKNQAAFHSIELVISTEKIFDA